MLIRHTTIGQFILTVLYLVFELGVAQTVSNKCYSCASENMQENFILRTRGPQKRIREPRLYDNMCDLDTWLIREKSSVECPGQCFKWQQIVNNSGVYSYATIRGCYSDMFDMGSGFTSTPRPSHTECTSSIRNLECLDQSTIIEHTCWCQGEYCNQAPKILHSISLTILLLFFTVFFFKI